MLIVVHYVLLQVFFYYILIDTTGSKVYQRKTDKAYVIDEPNCIQSMYLISGDNVYLRREGGIEQQCRLECPGCKLFCAYRPVPIDQPSRYLYIVYDALTDTPIGMNKPKDEDLIIPSSIYQDDFGICCVKIDLNPGQMRSKICEINDNYVKFNLAVMPGNEGRVNLALLNYCSIVLDLPGTSLTLDLDDDNKLILQISDKTTEYVYKLLKAELERCNNNN